MKTPKEIKDGLQYCANSAYCDSDCPYYDDCDEDGCSLSRNALEYIEKLEADRAALEQHLKEHRVCQACKHERMGLYEPCAHCDFENNRFELREVGEVMP